MEGEESSNPSHSNTIDSFELSTALKRKFGDNDIKGNVTTCPKATPLGKKRKQDENELIKETKGNVSTIDQDTDNVFEVNDARIRSRTNQVHAYVARWVYESGVSFNSIKNDAFICMIEAIGKFGSGYVPPSEYQLRNSLLQQEVERFKASLKKQEDERKKNGCSVMIDVWLENTSIMNLCVNCNGETIFLSSVKDSPEVHTAEYIFQYIDKHIEEVGLHDVIQVVTNDVSTNMVAATNFLKEKRPNIFWSSCATHTMNLILEEIIKLPKFKSAIKKAKAFTTFVYSHHKTLTMMRNYTGKSDIVRPGVTRFASSFLTMDNILENAKSLKYMFCSNEWSECKWSTSVKGAKAYVTVVTPPLWNSLTICLEILKRLVRVLFLVDRDAKPSMGFVLGELMDAKKDIIKLCKNIEGRYKPILEVIDSKVEERLNSPLHLAGYMLNPYFYYRNDEVEKDPKCTEAVLTCIENFFSNDLEKQQMIANVELLKYKTMEGVFSSKLAVMGRSKNDHTYNPVGWWINYGCGTPNLRTMAIKILCLTTSSFGWERNWSAYHAIQTKKSRSRLDEERLKNLFYVQFNSKLLDKKKCTYEKYHLLLANDASMAQGWIVEGGDEEEVSHGLDKDVLATSSDGYLEPRNSTRNVRELDDDDFVSDDENEFYDENNLFEIDKEIMKNLYEKSSKDW